MTDNKELINRRIAMDIINGDTVSKEQYLEILKSDWTERGNTNPNLYVWAGKEFDLGSFNWSGKYDFDTYFVPAYVKRLLHTDDFLEIGCGMGRMTQFIYPYIIPSNYYALDISPSLLERAKFLLPINEFPNLHFIEGNGNKIPLLDSSVDFAFEYIVFQHIPYTEIIDDYIREIDRVLRKGGVFAGHFRDVGDASGKFMDSNTWHGCMYGPQQLFRILKDTALSLEYLYGSGTDNCWINLVKK